MYIWRKHATADWLRRQGGHLQIRFGGNLAIIEEPAKARSLAQISCGSRSEALRLQRDFGGTIEKLRADWLKQFVERSASKPLRIGSRLIVTRTSGAVVARNRQTIVVPAGAAFGTGDHATTAMCLRILERVTRTQTADWRMLDAGTGSGILAIAGKRLGAGKVLAIDNDPLACSIAKRNARANRLGNIEFRTGDVLTEKLAGKFDIITANLFSEILIAVLPRLRRHLAEDGYLIVSGIMRSQEKAITKALCQAGLSDVEVRRRGKWVALLAVAIRKNS